MPSTLKTENTTQETARVRIATRQKQGNAHAFTREDVPLISHNPKRLAFLPSKWHYERRIANTKNGRVAFQFERQSVTRFTMADRVRICEVLTQHGLTPNLGKTGKFTGTVSVASSKRKTVKALTAVNNWLQSHGFSDCAFLIKVNASGTPTDFIGLYLVA